MRLIWNLKILNYNKKALIINLNNKTTIIGQKLSQFNNNYTSKNNKKIKTNYKIQ